MNLFIIAAKRHTVQFLVSNIKKFIAVASALPFFAIAQASPLPSYRVPFRMEPLACPASSGGLSRMWSFAQPAEALASGRCFAYAAVGAGAMPVYSWQGERYLSLLDRIDYTVGAGVAACQKAVCAPQIGVGGGSSARALVLLAARLRPTPMLPCNR